MDSLYEMLEAVEKLGVREEVGIYGTDVILVTRGGPLHLKDVFNRPPTPKVAALVFDAVCHWLEQRRVPYQLEGKPSSSILDDTPFYGYSVWSTEFDANPLGLLASTPAHALLGAYLEYLKANHG